MKTSTVFELQKWFLHQNGVEFCAQCGQTGRNANKIPCHTSEVNYVRWQQPTCMAATRLLLVLAPSPSLAWWSWPAPPSRVQRVTASTSCPCPHSTSTAAWLHRKWASWRCRDVYIRAVNNPQSQRRPLVNAFNQEKALVGAFSVIVKSTINTGGAGTGLPGMRGM